jgi:hypothetical protein
MLLYHLFLSLSVFLGYGLSRLGLLRLGLSRLNPRI